MQTVTMIDDPEFGIAMTKLEFSEVLARLASHCQYSVAMERALQIRPSADHFRVEAALDETSEAVDLLTNFPDVTIGGAHDIRMVVDRAAKGGRIQPPDLLLIGDTLRGSRLLRRSVNRLPEGSTRFPVMMDWAAALIDSSELETTISRAIGPAGEVLDSASQTLSRVRKEVRVAHSRLTERLNRLVSSGSATAALQDSIVTSRDGRYVVPVRADARSQVPGVVHDVSASGQTLFVEPLEIVDLNNRWRELQIEEQREIDRILDELSHAVGSVATEIRASVEALAKFDLAFAKARLAFEMKASRPHIREQGGAEGVTGGHVSQRVSLKQARHPLLDPAIVVPVDVELGLDFRILLITGPNTGGKTVALKTIGLLALMTQSGLFIPARDDSVMSIFSSVLVDIGDDQSIAQSLSTFSAHITTIIAMLEQVDELSLVLIDEVGSGTDPVEGSALARAIIGELLQRGSLVVATTHYSEVKTYAYETPGVENASVEFDIDTLQPTYHVVTGIPGQSNALAIARRLGLSEKILDAATELVDRQIVRADVLLGEIRTVRNQAQRELDTARKDRQIAAQLRAEAAEHLHHAELQRMDARSEALAEAEALLSNARQTARRIQKSGERRGIAQISKVDIEESLERADQDVASFRRRVVAERPIVNPSSLRIGDRVEVSTLGQDGEIVTIEGNLAEVQLGGLKVRQPLANLKRLGRAIPGQTPKLWLQSPVELVPLEIDVRGARTAEVHQELESYLDSAYRSNVPSVRIIHGKGSGALRTAIKSFLRTHPAISRTETAPPAEGGDGVTIAFFKDS